MLIWSQKYEKKIGIAGRSFHLQLHENTHVQENCCKYIQWKFAYFREQGEYIYEDDHKVLDRSI